MIGALLLAAAVTQPAPIVFETSAEVVLLDAFVTRGGEPVSGLQAEDFEVLEGGERCEVQLVSPGEVPLAALLVLDTSRSVAGAKLSHLQRAVDAFVSGLAPHDQSLLLTFSQALQLRAPLSADRDAIRRALAGVVAGGRTSVYDAMLASLLMAPRLPGRPVVIVFTDGEDTSSWVGPESALRAARESETLVYAVGAGARLLADLATITGGRCIADEGSDLQASFVGVLHELRTRYLLRVSPGNSRPGWHEIKVRLRRGEADVRARQGYWRPERRQRAEPR